MGRKREKPGFGGMYRGIGTSFIAQKIAPTDEKEEEIEPM